MSESVQVPETFLYMKPSQVQQMRSEINALRSQISNPQPGGADKNEMMKRVRRMEQTLSRHTPAPLSADERDAYAREEMRLRQQFAQDMLSAQTMRRNPAGAVDAQLVFHKKHRNRIVRWKNVLRALHPEDDSPDLCNIERFRPHARPTDASMHDAQISGKTFVGIDNSPAYREGWERTFGDGDKDAPVEDVDALKAELAALRAEIAARGSKPERKAKPPSPGKLVAMPCGEMKDARGKRWHVDKCAACQQAMSAQTQDGATAA